MNFNGFNIEHLKKRINKNALSEGNVQKRLHLLKVLSVFRGKKREEFVPTRTGCVKTNPPVLSFPRKWVEDSPRVYDLDESSRRP